MREDARDRRVGEVIGRDVDRLHRGDRRSEDRRDAPLELGDLGRQGRLVSNTRGQAPEQAGDLAPGLDQAKRVVDEEQHVLVRDIAELLGDRERGQSRPPARTRRLVHLSEYERGAGEDTGSLELHAQLVTLTRSLSDPGEHREPGEPLHRDPDELHDQDRLANPGAPEQPGLAAAPERREQIDSP